MGGSFAGHTVGDHIPFVNSRREYVEAKRSHPACPEDRRGGDTEVMNFEKYGYSAWMSAIAPWAA